MQQLFSLKIDEIFTDLFCSNQTGYQSSSRGGGSGYQQQQPQQPPYQQPSSSHQPPSYPQGRLLKQKKMGIK